MKKLVLPLLIFGALYGGNQTSYISLPLREDSLPYRISIEQASFSLPVGLQSFVMGTVDEQWVFISGRTYGLHGFAGNTFPNAGRSTSVYVVNFNTGASFSRSLLDSSAELSQAEIDLLAVTNAFFFQNEGSDTLYMIGGYGYNTAKAAYETSSVLTAIDLRALVKWVKHEPGATSAAAAMRRISNPLLQVTGGLLLQSNPHQPYLIGLGQNFIGTYVDDTSEGNYTFQVRPFQIIDNGINLFIQPYSQPIPNPTYRRRDLNIVPIIRKVDNSLNFDYLGLGGVFTPGADGGAWTIPIEIKEDGSSAMLDASNPNTFAQGMNNYSCPTISLYSQSTNDMYVLLFGGISFYYSQNGGFYEPGGSFIEDASLGFNNDITTIRIDSSGNYNQYFMSGTFPTIVPPFGTDPGPALLFGSNAVFIPADGIPIYPNGVIAFDKLGSEPIVLGYIVGGIASSRSEAISQITNVDTRSSSYIFSVILTPTN